MGLQINAGKSVHVLQFRRCLFSVLQEVFQGIAQNPEVVRANTPLYDEMLVLESLLPMVVSDLKAKIDPVVTASDASETGGGACFASRLSQLGVDELEELMNEENIPEGELSKDFTEREVLMGLKKGHAMDLARKFPVEEKERQIVEDKRCAAMGNAFHATVVAALFDHALWSIEVKALLGHQGRPVMRRSKEERCSL